MKEEKNSTESKIKKTDESYRREKESLEQAVLAHSQEMSGA